MKIKNGIITHVLRCCKNVTIKTLAACSTIKVLVKGIATHVPSKWNNGDTIGSTTQSVYIKDGDFVTTNEPMRQSEIRESSITASTGERCNTYVVDKLCIEKTGGDIYMTNASGTRQTPIMTSMNADEFICSHVELYSTDANSQKRLFNYEYPVQIVDITSWTEGAYLEFLGNSVDTHYTIYYVINRSGMDITTKRNTVDTDNYATFDGAYTIPNNMACKFIPGDQGKSRLILFK